MDERSLEDGVEVRLEVPRTAGHTCEGLGLPGEGGRTCPARDAGHSPQISIS